MCDTLCLTTPAGMLFAKNSDRPVDEVQLVEAYDRRPGGGRLRTQYLEIPDTGAAALVIARPQWLWGAEHGVNEHGVAIGNEKIYTVLDPYQAAPGLIGMDLVRLGLERARDSDEALAVMTQLLERHGQGGVADAAGAEPYFSSFLIADARRAWVLETSGRTWAARPVDRGTAISNRMTIRSDWTRASADVATGADFDAWRNPDAPTGHADRRRAAGLEVVRRAETSELVSPASIVAHLRDHGDGPWGEPGRPGAASCVPALALPDGTGVTVCMHVRGYQATTSALVAQLAADPAAPRRAWVAGGSPCVSVFVPVFPPGPLPAELADAGLWRCQAALRAWVEAEPDALAEVRAVLDPLEAELWAEADVVAADPPRRRAFTREAGRRLAAAVTALRPLPD